MRRRMQSSVIAALAGLFAAGVVFGGDKPAKSPAEKAACSHGKAAKAVGHEYKPELLRLTELKGMKLLNEKGETLGKVEDTIIDIDYGRLAYAVVSLEGLAGIGNKDILLPFVTIHWKSEGAKLCTKATLDQFKQAEGFNAQDPEQVKKLHDPAFAERFHRHYSVRPYWEWTARSSEKHEKMGWREKGTTEFLEEFVKEPVVKEGYESEPGKAGEQVGEIAHKGGPGEMVLASTLYREGGVKIKTDAGADVGNLDNLMVDLTRGHIAYAIVNREKELVPENRLTAVPWALFRLREGQPRPNLIVDLAVAKIKDAHGFAAGQWPDMTKMAWNEEVNSYFDSTPYYVIYGYVSGAEKRGAAHTIEGTIVSINRSVRGPGLDRPGVQVALKVEKDRTEAVRSLEGQTVMVNLAPTWYLDEKGIALIEGGKLKITGYAAVERAEMPKGTARHTVLVGYEVWMGEKSASLRNELGEPMWTWKE